MRKILILALISFTQFIFAQDKGTVKGIVTDKEMSNEPLPFANVFVKGTSIGGNTEMDGTYSISIAPGNYTLVFSFVGYQTIEKPITIVAGKTITVNQVMGASGGEQLEEIQINATVSKDKESALLLEQKKATVIKESIGAQELAKKGISDAAGAVSKISGVSKEEGNSNVYVRGLGDRYLNTTMNGLTLPSNDVNKKNIDLNLFSSNIIENVSISKAYSSEFYGDFAAGNVNITSKEYKGKGMFEVTVGTGVNSSAAGQDFVKSEGTGQFGYYGRYGSNPFARVLSHGIDPVDGGAPINANIGISAGKSYTFKDDSKLSLYGTASFERDFEYREGPAVDFITVFKKSFPNAKEYQYSTKTTVLGTALYRINDNNKLKYTSMFLNSSSDEVGYYGFKGLGENRDAILNTDEGFYQMNVQFNQDLVFVNQLTGDHKFYKNDDDDKPELEVSWGIGYNNVFAHEPDRRRISIENYQFSLDNDPTTNATFFNNNVFDNQRYFQRIIDEELNSRISLKYNASDILALNFGYNGRVKTRDFENIRYGYNFVGNNVEVDPNNIDATINLQNTQFFQNQTGKLYNIEVFNQIPGYQNSNIVSLPGTNENEYSGELRIHASYVSANITPNEKWTIVPGVRLEYLDQRIDYEVININPNDAGFREVEQTFFLPNLNVKYSLTDDSNLRFSYAKTVSVPEFKEVAPFVYEDVTERIGGNSDLLNDPSFSAVHNLDLKYEWFMTRGEILSVTGFYKQINDPVNLVIANDATGTQRYFRTGDQAEVIGAELEVRKALIRDEDDKTQLGFGFNFTYMHTQQDLKSTTGLFTATFNRDSDEVQGASPYIFNANIDYSPTQFENYKPVANLVFSYFSDRIYALGSGTGNIVQKGVPTLDFVWKNEIGKHLEINFSAKNLLDPSIERVREINGADDVSLSKYNRGINLGLGLKYKL